VRPSVGVEGYMKSILYPFEFDDDGVEGKEANDDASEEAEERES